MAKYTNSAAFYDVDGTLIDGYSAAKFMQDRMRRGDISVGEATRLVRATLAPVLFRNLLAYQYVAVARRVGGP